ncbi:hypothetical protein QQX10_10355 [Demequina sp. SYSU T00039]|uniref:DUF4178 domain-containing protein n=1 Tax=Demequina lignilytica TaxID=3051663 RepID=A0AAW7M8N6_9MICO|nr:MULTISPECIES: hypothetical protein [unclassified Demequina]MDN4478590.1 hypothetical protein [Demequina sp. SYSU T00039-1]MDN4488568.1 hypothetical protein [Demequina sp. SYSU T00039]MDN4491575.1 hypothetical protein [Demequina sp. SYSU T00068]
MVTKLRIIGAVLALAGLGFIGAGIYAFTEVQAGQNSLQKFSEAQNVQLTYNEDGVLIDRGTVEGAEGIMSLLVDDWGYKVVESEFDPNDPLVNTGSEYMYQMALVGYHTLHGTTTVTLDEAVEYNGETFEAGTYEVPTDGKYWADFDRMHPLEGPARAQAWNPTAHALFGELGVGSVTASTLKLGLGIVGMISGLGLLFLALGAGLFWISGDVARKATAKVEETELATA